jgi:pyruvate dehydrogenase E1 component alpha subunit
MKSKKTLAQSDRLIILYKTMLLIRQVELTLARIFADGEVPGFIHLCIGQEAVAAGVTSAMQQGDTLATTHRGHGHVLARGLDLDGFFKEIMGRAGGICQGRGGSMHIADMRLGIIGANGIVGAGIPISVGSALAMKLRKTGSIAVAMFGDGAMAEGVFHESLNLAALLKLPILFVCENNGWSEFSRTEKQFSGKLSKMAEAFGIGHGMVDGNDALSVADAASHAMERLRNGEGPSVLECLTHRMRGHFEGDAQKYRTETEVQEGLERDPLTLAAVALQQALVPSEEILKMQAQIEVLVNTALTNARQDAPADFEVAFNDVYTPVEA